MRETDVMNTEKVAELMDQIRQNRFQDISLQKKLCEKLYNEGTKQNSDELIGTALFYQAEALFHETPSDCETYARKSIPFLINSNCNELLARANNLLGIIESNKENLSVSLEYLLNCYEICQQNQFNHIQGLCSCNIGVIFQLLESYQKAISYYRDAISSFQKDSDNEYFIQNIITACTNIFICSSRLKDFSQMEPCLHYLREHREQVEPIFCLSMFEAEYFNLKGEKQKAYTKFLTAVEQCLTADNVLDDIDSYQILCNYLFEMKMLDELMPILDLVEQNLPEKAFPRIRIALLKYRLYCLEEKRDFAEYAKWTNIYIKTYELITENYHQSVLESVNLRLCVASLRDQESKYKQSAMTDSLTQLYNRSGFFELGNQLLSKAIRNQTTISIFIIDIDYFKQVNDFYGHAYGDECIKKISQILIDLQSNDIIAGRYGGDEFVMICYGSTYENIQKISEDLLKKIVDLKIESENSPISDYVTLSIGIYHLIPNSSDTLTDLLLVADQALYKVKENGRNDYWIKIV